jgi:hypothetical protein
MSSGGPAEPLEVSAGTVPRWRLHGEEYPVTWLLAELITRAAEVPMPTDHSGFTWAHAASTVARHHHHLDRIVDVFALRTWLSTLLSC